MSEPLLTIISRDNAVELSLTSDRVHMTLAESALQEFRNDVRADPDAQAAGLIGRFVRFVTGAADKLLSSGIEYAIADIESVTVRNGTLVFVYGRRSYPSFDAVSIVLDGVNTPALAAFAPADAQTFAERFAAEKAQQSKG